MDLKETVKTAGGYFTSQNRGNYFEDRTYYGSSSNKYDVRYADDPHQTYGRAADYYDKEEKK